VPEEREDLCAAETEHEEERGEDVDPEVDDDHHGENVDRLVACENAHFSSFSLPSSFSLFFLSILIHFGATVLLVLAHVRVHILKS